LFHKVGPGRPTLAGACIGLPKSSPAEQAMLKLTTGRALVEHWSTFVHDAGT